MIQVRGTEGLNWGNIPRENEPTESNATGYIKDSVEVSAKKGNLLPKQVVMTGLAAIINGAKRNKHP